MILSDHEIMAALTHGQVRIDPRPTLARYTTSSVDLTLGDEFKRWRAPVPGYSGAIDPSAHGYDYNTIATSFLEPYPTESDGSVILAPQQFMLGITHERVELPEPSRIAARVEGRSSLGRLGLGIHVTAPIIHSGFRGKVTLEMTNHGTYPIKLRPGLAICQLVFEHVFGTPAAAMRGVFQDQTSVSGKK
jgi:dCTP deaminase